MLSLSSDNDHAGEPAMAGSNMRASISSCAEPRCSILRDPRPVDYRICTAVACAAIHGARTPESPELVCNSGPTLNLSRVS